MTASTAFFEHEHLIHIMVFVIDGVVRTMIMIANIFAVGETFHGDALCYDKMCLTE